MAAAAEVVVLVAAGAKTSPTCSLDVSWCGDDGRLLKICVPDPF